MSKLIINVETGETVERELTEEELAQQAIDEAEIKKGEANAEAVAAAKATLLAKLGITEEEAKLLIG